MVDYIGIKRNLKRTIPRRILIWLYKLVLIKIRNRINDVICQSYPVLSIVMSNSDCTDILF